MSWRRKRPFLLAFASIVLALFLGCEVEPDETGGETHFLRRCSSDLECGTNLACLCGVCSVSCQEQASCSPFAAAQCTSWVEAGCSKDAPHNFCGVACARDADCAVVSAEHRCVTGLCQAGVPDGAGGTGGSSSPAGGTGGSAGAIEVCDKGHVPANEVLLIGDSFFAQSHQTTAFIEARARQAGVLAAGDRYRDSSRLIGNGLAFPDEGILEQYTTAFAESPVRVVILNGGGADVLLGSCDTVNAECPLLTDAAAAIARLFSTMASDALLGIVLVGYPEPQAEAVKAKMDVLRPMLEQECAQSEVPCYFLDLRPIFADHYDTYIQGDGMNPTQEGAEAAADAIWATMVDNCIAQ